MIDRKSRVSWSDSFVQADIEWAWPELHLQNPPVRQNVSWQESRSEMKPLIEKIWQRYKQSQLEHSSHQLELSGDIFSVEASLGRTCQFSVSAPDDVAQSDKQIPLLGSVGRGLCSLPPSLPPSQCWSLVLIWSLCEILRQSWEDADGDRKEPRDVVIVFCLTQPH